MALCGIADRLHAGLQQQFQHSTLVVGRAADDEIVRCLAPIFPQPVNIGLKAAGSGDEAMGLNAVRCAIVPDGGGNEPTIVNFQTGDRRVIDDRDTEPFGGPVERVHQRLAAAEIEGVGARQTERAAERGLKANAVRGQPGGKAR